MPNQKPKLPKPEDFESLTLKWLHIARNEYDGDWLIITNHLTNTRHVVDATSLEKVILMALQEAELTILAGQVGPANIVHKGRPMSAEERAGKK